jgi:hypothetical protein
LLLLAANNCFIADGLISAQILRIFPQPDKKFK